MEKIIPDGSEKKASGTDILDAEQTVRDIKKELRANMNGVASVCMRRAGVPYHVIWGIELPRLQEIADEFPAHRKLGQLLWNENVRECQLLGILLTPTSEFLPEVAEIWVHEAKTPEAISLLAMKLIAPQKWASKLAFQWVAGSEEMPALCGWLTLCHLLRDGAELMPRSEMELRDHATAIGTSASLFLRKAVAQTLSYLDRKVPEECK